LKIDLKQVIDEEGNDESFLIGDIWNFLMKVGFRVGVGIGYAFLFQCVLL
jgi:hypothetical protein